jgi:hypothetical protein
MSKELVKNTLSINTSADIANSTDDYQYPQESIWEIVDNKVDPPYYWNKLTNEVTYEIPIELQYNIEKDNEQIYDEAPVENCVWEVVQDDPVYYWNKVTNEVTYDMPMELQNLEPNEYAHYLPMSPYAFIGLGDIQENEIDANISNISNVNSDDHNEVEKNDEDYNEEIIVDDQIDIKKSLSLNNPMLLDENPSITNNKLNKDEITEEKIKETLNNDNINNNNIDKIDKKTSSFNNMLVVASGIVVMGAFLFLKRSK